MNFVKPRCTCEASCAVSKMSCFSAHKFATEIGHIKSQIDVRTSTRAVHEFPAASRQFPGGFGVDDKRKIRGQLSYV